MNAQARKKQSLSTLLTVGALLLSLIVSTDIAKGVRAGLSLAAEAVIPSVFPSMLLADLLICAPWGGGGRGRLLRRFGLSPIVSRVLLAGCLSGFPVGASLTARLCAEGYIDRTEAERLLLLSCHTGPAFLIAGVGSGLFGRASIGVLLYVCQLLAACAVGLLSAPRRRAPRDTFVTRPTAPSYRFVDSVRRAAVRCVELTGFLCLFSAAGALLQRLPCSVTHRALLLSMLELTGATAYCARMLPELLSLPLCAFAVGFCGLSVHTQTATFAREGGLRMGRFFIGKLIVGVVSAFFCFVFYCFFL